MTDTLPDTQPGLKVAFENLDRSNSSNLVHNDDISEEEMILPEAFTQLGVGSPGNTSTGTIMPTPPRHSHCLHFNSAKLLF